MKQKYRPYLGLFILVALAVAHWSVSDAHATVTVPQKIVYNGHLLHSNGLAVTVPHNIRFSLWTTTDYKAGDVTASGAINTATGSYANWSEVHTVRPDPRGYFTVDLGSSVVLPDFSTLSAATLNSLHLQVEVRATGSPDIAYELLDKDASDDTVDRAPLLSVPLAMNADLLDGREWGTAQGNIPVLGTGGFLDTPGTNADFFIVDADDSVGSGSSLGIQFGSTLAKTLSYNQPLARFELNDALHVAGNITASGSVTIENNLVVKGTINGVSIGQEVVEEIILHPFFPGGSYAPDGTDNIGQLRIRNQVASPKNYYGWSSTKDTLQDYTVILAQSVPSDFVRWADNAIEVMYRTTTGSTAAALNNIILFDTADTLVTLSGATTNLANTAWTTASIDLTGSPTFTVNDDFQIAFLLAARDEEEAHLGTVKLRYIRKTGT